LDGKDLVKGIIVATLAYVFIGLAGALFSIAIFPDPSLGMFALGKVLFAFAFIVIVAVITALAPRFLK